MVSQTTNTVCPNPSNNNRILKNLPFPQDFGIKGWFKIKRSLVNGAIPFNPWTALYRITTTN